MILVDGMLRLSYETTKKMVNKLEMKHIKRSQRRFKQDLGIL